MLQGFLLAATVLEDRETEEGLRGLCPALVERVRAVLTALPDDREERLSDVKTIARGTRVRPEMEDRLSPRARALVAVDVAREVGERWLSEAPPIRKGYRAPTGLRRTLRKAACSALESNDARSRRELEEIEVGLESATASHTPERSS